MVALTIDTAANWCAVALSDMASGKILASFSNDIGRGHAEILMGLIEQCLDQAGVGFVDIERVISTTGPGSFTGVRVGLSCARAIALALNAPVVGVSNLQACAAHAVELSPHPGEPPTVFVLMDARRNEVYFQQFKNNISEGEPVVATIDDLVKSHAKNIHENDIVCGSGAARFLEILSDVNPDLPHQPIHHESTAPISCIARLGLEAQIPDKRPLPLYLRGPDAKVQQGFAIDRVASADIRQ